MAALWGHLRRTGPATRETLANRFVPLQADGTPTNADTFHAALDGLATLGLVVSDADADGEPTISVAASEHLSHAVPPSEAFPLLLLERLRALTGRQTTFMDLYQWCVRDVQEYVDRDLAYLFDDEPGGAGVCELLLDPAENFVRFRTALRVAAGLTECGCDDGCPHCLFQYGCSRRNTPHELSRRAVAQFAGAFDRLELVEDAP